MQCRQFRSQVDWFLQTLGVGRKYDAMRQHARECSACASELKAERDLRLWFVALPKPAAPPGFQERILSRAIAQGEQRHAYRRRKWIQNLVPIVATVCAVVFLAVWLWPASSQPAASTSEVALSLHETRQVGFIFHVRHRIQNARIVVNLPEGVEIDGHRTRRLSWHVDLNRGDNLLKLPLIARTPGNGVVSAEVIVVGSAMPLASARLVTHVADSSRAAVPAGTSGV